MTLKNDIVKARNICMNLAEEYGETDLDFVVSVLVRLGKFEKTVDKFVREVVVDVRELDPAKQNWTLELSTDGVFYLENLVEEWENET